MDVIEEYDKNKTKVLKYVLYKKRTEQEIRMKFAGQIEEDMLADIMEELKENGYINDTEYIERAVREFIALKSLSRKELQYKLYSKGLSRLIVEAYMDNNREELEEYELKSAIHLIRKKQGDKEEIQIREELRKKGYYQEVIEEALEAIRRD